MRLFRQRLNTQDFPDRRQHLADFGQRHPQLARSKRVEFLEDLHADDAARLGDLLM